MNQACFTQAESYNSADIGWREKISVKPKMKINTYSKTHNTVGNVVFNRDRCVAFYTG